MKNSKIQNLIKTSKKVILDCCLENGAIVAANSTKLSYPKDIQNYFYIWPRDAAFICVAADILKLHDIPKQFFNWCLERGIDKNGLFWHRYEPNGIRNGFIIPEWYNLDLSIGPKFIKTPHGIKVINVLSQFTKYFHPDGLYESGALLCQLQPDQNGLVLWAIKEHAEYDQNTSRKFKELIKKLADGICSLWDTDLGTYKFLYHDAWEEKIGFPGINITYDVIIDILGLECAMKLTSSPKKEWGQTVESMQNSLKNSYDKKTKLWKAVYGPNYQKETYKKMFTDILLNPNLYNPEIDINLLSLVYPASITDKEEAKILLRHLLRHLSRGDGIIRYPGDKFEGGHPIREYEERKKAKSNIWPLLNFWTAIALSRAELKQEALKYYNWVIDRVENYIPEQIDAKGKYKGPSPLAWSHNVHYCF